MTKYFFDKEVDGIYRLKVPFMSVYTSVFLINANKDYLLVDCATTDSDVDGVIVPALKELNLSANDIKYLILTHNHGDHAGGKERLLQLNPNLKVINNAVSLDLDQIEIVALKGHTLDCIGVFDNRTGTLISGDGIQGHGIGKFRCSLESQDEYLKTLEKIEKDKRIQKILFSHEYEPWYKAVSDGREQILNCLSDCREYLKRRKQ